VRGTAVSRGVCGDRRGFERNSLFREEIRPQRT
jgi:hypothetical protein